ncbi:efflux RND transporter periplasmic adaptor subunit [Candidatus Parcubacteria bacterium]|nr:efflux RND transporter periplasmic adaptor subunit [Candidatus Parcubacteria bacterium]
MLFKGEGESLYETIVAERGNLVQEISATGRVEAISYVDLAFEKSGRIIGINVDVGDEVYKGQTLMYLDSSELSAQLQSSEATLKLQEAKLDELKTGTRPEEIKIQEVKVVNAQTVVSDAKNSVIDDLRDSYIKSDDAVRNKVDQFFDNPKSQNPTLSFSMVDPQLKIDLEWGRLIIESMFPEWKTSLEKLSASSDIALSISEGKRNLNQVSSFLDKAASAVNSLSASSEVSQTSIDTWKLAIATARTNVSTAIISITDAEQTLATANSNLSVEENNLILEKAGTIPEQISAQEASVNKAKADIDVYKAQIAKTILRSPIVGIVTKQDTKKGVIVGANEIIVSVMSEGKFEIDAFVVEADIANLEVGDKATLLLDAYREDVLFEATVIKINPAAELIEGVANYKTTLAFSEDDKRIRAGMTADIDIITAERENVISIPQRAVIYKNNKNIVRLLENDVLREVEVKIGITGERGQIEIIDGINEGDIVVVTIKK